MTILDAYFLKRVVRPLVFVFLAFIGIYIVVDLFDRMNRFIDNEVPFRIVVLFYMYYAPNIIALTAPIAMLLASLLSIGRLSKRNEIMAIKGSGISLYRMFVPVLLLACVLTLGVIAMAETVLPPATRSKLAIEEDYLQRDRAQAARMKTDLRYLRPDGTMFLIRRYDIRKQEMHQVTVEEFDRADRLMSRVDAASAAWKDGQWVFRNGRLRRFAGDVEKTTPFAEIALGHSEPTPEELIRRRLKPEEMGSRDLKSYIGKLRASGNDPKDLMVQLRLKTAFPFVILVMALLGASFAVRARKTGFALSFASALAISFVYYGMIRVGQVLGAQGILSPVVAAWGSNVIFTAVGLWILVKTPK